MAKERKIAMVGARAVGKSSLTLQFVEDHFIDHYYPTIENQFNKSITHNGIEYSLEILDTAGQDEFSIINNKLLIGVHGYILIYSINSRQSFEMLNVVRDKILDSSGATAEEFEKPMILVGNKSDLNLQRQVSLEELETAANEKFGGIPFVECSAKLNYNVDSVFKKMVDEIEAMENPVDPEEEKKKKELEAKDNKCLIMPSGPSDVVVTGTFDNWSQSFPLVKQTDGSFELTIPFDSKIDKIYFKYVIDGEWQTTDKFKEESDESGNKNNVLYAADLVSATATTSSKIPEAGGLAVPVTTTTTTTPAPVEEETPLKTTVMPSTEGQQVTLGEPGIVIPSNPHEIEAFTQIRTLDPKALNEPEEAAPAAPAETKEETSTASATATEEPVVASTTEATPDLTSETSSKKVKYVKKVVTKVKKGEEDDEPVVADVDDKASSGVVKKVEPVTKEAKEVKKKRGLFSKIKKALK
ncbi:carbohydrate-binding module family 48 protein [[Candida] arabinofermentans NRRL YB-2248]|uniref:Carbohydrate-binding module family 48 protein n=1 Tax=[Candida] arabinofermentans NRRL YB-2248 TaxID=983967 RepID=A0A1E4T6S5_9ASCO|nr:carbohydrate-binding module family 48 protein [[Candida] arabinofermentans NRRL YB-2248]